MSNFDLLEQVSRRIAHLETEDPAAALRLCRLLRGLADDNIERLENAVHEPIGD
jgi:hypothetical protein